MFTLRRCDLDTVSSTSNTLLPDLELRAFLSAQTIISELVNDMLSLEL